MAPMTAISASNLWMLQPSLVNLVRVVLLVGDSWTGAGALTAESYCSIFVLEEPSRPKSSRQKTLWLWLVA